MKRVIRFRGKIANGKNAGQWVYWGVKGTNKIDQIDPDTIGQFTGYKDKEGQRVFEDDIVSAGKTVCLVVWNENKNGWSAMWSRTQTGRIGKFSAKPDLGYEKHRLLGNIHDNPELLSKS